MDKIKGKIVVYLFQKEDGYNIAKVRTEMENITISGYFPVLPLNQIYTFEGEYFNHPKHGKGLKVYTLKRSDNSLEGIVNYLSSYLFTGIGEKTAKKIYESFGEKCIEKIIDDINILDVMGFNDEKKQKFYDELVENRFIEEILIELYKHQITSKMAMKLYQKYGLATINVINKNPYRLVNDIDGIGFIKADGIAKKLGFVNDNPVRIKAAIIHVFSNALYKEGHTFLKYDQIFNESRKYIGDIGITDYLDELVKENILIRKNKEYYLTYVYNAENNFAIKIKTILDNPYYEYDNLTIDKMLELESITYSEKQIKAIKKSLCSPISIITGGPGTGKTTIIKALLKIYKSLNRNKKIMLMAPTGRAAKRMMEATSHEAKTIHRTLGMDFEGNFIYNDKKQLEVDLIVIDESSMIDLFLANSLLKAIPNNCQIVFVGDEDQLPSVGPGLVLGDLIASDIIDYIRLTEIHRQAQDSGIISLSYSIKNQDVDVVFSNDDVTFIKSEKHDIANKVISIVKRVNELGYKDIQVLVPMYKGAGGIDDLNINMQKAFNKEKQEVLNNNKVFKKGDKVLQLSNNPSKKIMNGDVGEIKDIINYSKDNLLVRVDFDGLLVDYKKNELDDLTHAYAVSVHKAQGSEYKVVIFVILRAHTILLKKKLIYTAVTRAKELLYIIGDEKTFFKGIYGFEEKRQTALVQKLVKKEVSPYDFL